MHLRKREFFIFNGNFMMKYAWIVLYQSCRELCRNVYRANLQKEWFWMARLWCYGQIDELLLFWINAKYWSLLTSSALCFAVSLKWLRSMAIAKCNGVRGFFYVPVMPVSLSFKVLKVPFLPCFIIFNFIPEKIYVLQ